MKILLLGSGALKIGQAGEFDYSGSQAIKTFKANGHEVILINPNIATVQTDPKNFAPESSCADKVYFLPVTTDFVERIIEKEKPDALALSFGGQTALNCGLDLEEAGILAKHNVRVLGTPVDVIRATEDREIFVQKCTEVGVKTPRSIPARTMDQAFAAAEKIGFPLIMRAGFTLGGQGSGFCETKDKFEAMVKDAFAFSPQVLVEEDLRGWKELEYEVVRDGEDNCITVVNMENFDPLGIHTGESIVISPSMTLSNQEWQMLRTVAIKTIRHLGIVGECNIQYALNPNDPHEYRVIEVNPRLSRSSALASKATGYPLAAVAAEIMLGKRLADIPNAITKVTTAYFEPALDYVALKIPRWDLQKFRKVSEQIATEMKSVGEVMALGRNFPEVLQKAVRMLGLGSEGILDSPIAFKDKAEVTEYLQLATPRRLFAVSEALYKNYYTVEEIFEFTKIDHWFLTQVKRVTDMAQTLEKNKTLDVESLRAAKVLGFSDEMIARLVSKTFKDIYLLRRELNILPVAKQVDTLAAEFPAQTNYLYTTYLGNTNDV
ncbi:carbamoyl-phosphate synthase large subunit [bacterium]|nr:carbamoyl-phosphate synthase large subunit [bacterium]NCQ55579.1 carbamoyl-phosphate synthase large subunit [Candidatus Parcubacteria bacterium]NCS67404.1 carbamoyl-phosphate synthase large subunit [Candidatus Peregrinibacteria bacterium]NCS96130.1 carbamoyl-phosphate synthase large subunit [bacterium]